MTHDFLKEVFAGQKSLLLKANVNHIQVPHYDELSVRRLWPEFKKDAEFMKYFPSKYPKDKGPPRDYFFNILNTIHPEYLGQIMHHANVQRMTGAGMDQQKESIRITEFWEQELKDMPYLSRKSNLFY